MGMITVGLMQVFSYTGQNLAIIRLPNPTREHFDTAWTMSVCVGAFVSVLLLAIAPLAAGFFSDPRLIPVIHCLALVPVINGFTNVEVVVGFRKNLLFNKEFRFLVFRKLSGFSLTVPLAFILRDYWALVAGTVGGELLAVIASYWVHPRRPRLCLSKFREIRSFSGWMQLAALGNFFGDQSDQIVYGHIAGTTQLGGYHVAADLATAPTSELIAPMARAVFPVYATLLDDRENLVQSYLSVLSIVAMIAASTSVGVALVGDDLVTLVLGAKWAAIGKLVPWLALAGGAIGVMNTVHDILAVTGNVRLNAIWTWTFVVMLAPAAALAGADWGGEGVAAARAIVVILLVLLMFYSLTHVISVTLGEIFGCLWRPVVAASIMASILWPLSSIGIATLSYRLLFNIGLGVVTFAAALLSLWFLAGRPPGAERTLIGFARKIQRWLYSAVKRSKP
jgi:O-antigen/teichoic acid export membrane protein